MGVSNSKQVVIYSSNSPSVLFHRMRDRLHDRWDRNKMVASVRRWLRPSKKMPAKANRRKTVKTRAGLIIPDAHDPFMLIAKSDPMSNLLAENQRLRGLINELIREGSPRRDPSSNIIRHL